LFQCDYVIDNFYSSSNTISVSNGNTFPYSNSIFTLSDPSNIIGGERDLSLYVSTADYPINIDTGVNNTSFFLSSPSTSSTITRLQYDGKDSSMLLNPSGLGGIDLRSYGDSFQFSIEAEINPLYYQGSKIYINVYSGSNSSYCSSFYIVDGLYDEIITMPFLYFTFYHGGCNFSNVGAIELVFQMTDNTQIVIHNFNIVTTNIHPPPHLSSSQSEIDTTVSQSTTKSFSTSSESSTEGESIFSIILSIIITFLEAVRFFPFL